MESRDMVLIADSGSTKTAWCLKMNDSGERTYFTTSGINPSLQNEEDVYNVFLHELMPNISDKECVRRICFYGAGCTPQRSRIITDALMKAGFLAAEIFVGSDMLGAAKSVCGNNHGVVGILGTGSNSCVYDGEKITANTPSLGFILGDEGSGGYIGKRLVGDCLKGVMPERICKMFVDETGLDVPTIVQKVYREPAPNKYLAGLSRFCANHLDEPEIRHLLVDSFEQFFRRNIMRYEMPDRKVHLVGSVADVYREMVVEAAKKCSLSVGTILRSPIDGLAEQEM